MKMFAEGHSSAALTVLLMNGFPTSHPSNEPVADLAFAREAQPLGGLSTSALLSMWVLAQSDEVHSPVVQGLMNTHGWTRLRAWRHWLGYSKTEMARRLDVHRPTYELIEDGTVELGPWLLPAIEQLLLD
jgi:DNA-binding XRE family transcriptional regulator